MTLSRSKRIGLYCLSALLIALLVGLFFSAKLRHQARRVVIKTEMTLARWRGHPPQFVSLAGNLGIAGAQIQALDSRSGWAALADREGQFLLLDVTWYPGARQDLILSTDGQTGKVISVTLPQDLSGGSIINLGNLSFEHGKTVDLRDLPGITTVQYNNYDAANGAFYRDLYEQLTAGKQTDEARVSAVNDYVATKLNYYESQWDIGSPRRILETGSQYCGHLSAAMATLLWNGKYKVREIHLSNGQSPPSTHAVVEVFYGGAWHVYDPTYGTVYRNGDGAVASYKELRLDPSAIKEELFQRFPPKQRPITVAMLIDIYRTGHHHFYCFKDQM
jgi:Transglutaminase-like enzymes, putative cysteine proteases